VSPILFMLYISPLFHLGDRSRRFGYADDGAILAISRSLTTNTQILSQDLSETLAWVRLRELHLILLKQS
jgi:hypothetical protein